MKQSELILDKAALLPPKSIQEDQIPRDGGLWPEYAHTLVVCLDRLEDGLAEGRIYCYCNPKECPFRGLDQLLFTIEDLLDESDLVQPWSMLRSLKAERRKDDAKPEKQKARERAKPYWKFRSLHPMRGKLASFYLRVYSRQHVSLQGILSQAECKNCTPVAFRSALELMRMLQGALKE